MRVRLFDSFRSTYPDLSAALDYEVVGIEADYLRIVNDQGKPYLYPPSAFRVLDPAPGSDWITFHGDDGEEYSYPPELGESGFFEDYFDGKAKAVETFEQFTRSRRATSGA